MKIYRTSDMEQAVRSMMNRNSHNILLKYYENLRRIFFRGNLVKDIPTTIVRAWDSFAEDSIAIWAKRKTLMMYIPDRHKRSLPKCDAMLITEVPTNQAKLESLFSNVKHEGIFYRPPTWELHDEMVDFEYPTAEVYRTVMEAVTVKRGNYGMMRREGCALKLSEFIPKDTSVFGPDEIPGVSDKQVNSVLINPQFKRFYIRYSCYVPVMAPDDEAGKETYDRLCSIPPTWNEERMLPFGRIEGSSDVMGFKRKLRHLIKRGHVIKKPHIYVVGNPGAIDWSIIDAVSNARRGDWFKIKNDIDNAEEYPL